MTCWVGLDDATTENGCLHYIPGSHKWDLIEPTILAGDMDALKNKLTESQIEEFENQVAVEMKRGYATFHHPLMVHGSYENKSDRPRRASVINVFAEGTKSKYNDGMWEGILMPPNGQKMDGQFYPLLFDPKNIQHEN